jgi:hypothetical protein
LLRIFRSTFPSDSRIDKTMPWTSVGDSCTDGDPQGPLEFGEARSRRAGNPRRGFGSAAKRPWSDKTANRTLQCDRSGGRSASGRRLLRQSYLPPNASRSSVWIAGFFPSSFPPCWRLHDSIDLLDPSPGRMELPWSSAPSLTGSHPAQFAVADDSVASDRTGCV